MNLIFFGTPDFAAQILDALLDGHFSVVAIVTQPDKAAGRNLQVKSSAVKHLAKARAPAIPIFQPEKASDPFFLDQLRELQADLFVVVAYGQILSRTLLSLPPLGCINIHASLLPKYRGAAPIHRPIINGDKETGVSIQKMIYQLDAGDVIAEVKTEISADLTFGELEQRLCDLSKPLLFSVLRQYETGIPSAHPQDHAQSTYASKISPEETEIRWDREAEVLHNLIRGLSPRPGAWCRIKINQESKRLKVLRAQLSPQLGSPGELLAFQKNNCFVAAQNGSLQLLEVQPEGKKPMAVGDWIRGCSSPPSFS